MWDKQAVLRGACSCGDCQEFMAGNAVRCDYCDCSPARHAKIHTLSSNPTTANFSQVTFKTFPEPPDALKSLGISEILSCLLSNKERASDAPQNAHQLEISDVKTVPTGQSEIKLEVENAEKTSDLNQAVEKTFAESNGDIASIKSSECYAKIENIRNTKKSVTKTRKRTRIKTKQKAKSSGSPDDPGLSNDITGTKGASCPKKKRGRPPKFTTKSCESTFEQQKSGGHAVQTCAGPGKIQRTGAESGVMRNGITLTATCDIWRIDHTQLPVPESGDVIDNGGVDSISATSHTRPVRNRISECSMIKVKDEIFRCLECSSSFRTPKSAFGHMMYTHFKKYKFACMKCATLFRTNSQALRHKKKTDESQSKTCIGAIQPAEATESDPSKENQPIHNDPESQMKNSSSEEVAEGLESESGECELSFDTQNDMFKTGNFKEKEASFKCSQCPKEFTQASLLTKHKREEHRKTIKRKLAGIKGEAKLKKHKLTCGQMSEVSGSADDEAGAEFKEPQGKCPHCTKVFKKAKTLERHMLRFHSDHECSCQYCGKTYRRKHDLVIHERLHTGARPFECTVCDMRFRSKNNLQSHRAVHDMRGAFQCQYCGRRFDSKHGMLHHERSHTGEKPYECATCGKRFAHRCVLITHERVHTGEKPFVCTYCERGFKDQSTLRKHVRIHTLEKPYKCSYCDRAFNQKWYVKVHEKCHATGGASDLQQKHKEKKQEAPESAISNLDDQAKLLFLNPIEMGNVSKLQIVAPGKSSQEHTVRQQADQVPLQLAQQPPAVSQFVSHTIIPLTIPQVNVTHSQTVSSAHLKSPDRNVCAPTDADNRPSPIGSEGSSSLQSTINPQRGDSVSNSEQTAHRFYGNVPCIPLPPSHAGAHVESYSGGHGNAAAGIVAGPSALPPNPHSMLEVMSQSLESLEQHYSAAQRLYSGYLSSMSIQGGGSAAAAPAEPGSCSGHIPY